MNIYAKLTPEQKQAACIYPRRAPAKQPAWDRFAPGRTRAPSQADSLRCIRICKNASIKALLDIF